MSATEADVRDIAFRAIENHRAALAPDDITWAGLLDELRPTHDRYVAEVSTDSMAASIETCAYMLHLCRRLGARRVLDLGSGFSSWVLRHYAATARHQVAVVSVDHDPEWLARTGEFLTAAGMTGGQLVTLEQFEAFDQEPFDVVLHDIAGGDLRSTMAPQVCNLVAPGGVAIFDDMQHDGHRNAAIAAGEAAGMSVLSLHRRTLDKHFRFSMVAFRTTLAAEFARVCATPSDIYLHLPRMVRLVEETNAQHVIELGTRTGVSTIAWLHALDSTGGRLTSVDIDARPPIGDHDHWTFIQGDDEDPLILGSLDPADIVFIDTSHHYAHTLRELHAYRWLVRPGGLIVCHDTELPTPEGAPASDPPFPVKRAVEAFVAETGFEWLNVPECWGLGIIKTR